MNKLYQKYYHAIPLIIYGLIYMSWFNHLEKMTGRNYTVIHMAIDDKIPFCELFVVPYMLWFLYVAWIVLYLFFMNKNDYYKSCTFLFTGMTIFLIVSTFFPNIQHLRPFIIPRDNIFTKLVSFSSVASASLTASGSRNGSTHLASTTPSVMAPVRV